MKRVIDIHIDKLYRFDRVLEPCFLGVPLEKGAMYDGSFVYVCDGDKSLPLQYKVTSRYEDGSVRFLFLRFLADIPKNKNKKLTCVISDSEEDLTAVKYDALSVNKKEKGFSVETLSEGERVYFDINENIFESIIAGGKNYESENFLGPVLKTGERDEYKNVIKGWETVEEGPICTILKTKGAHIGGEKDIDFELRLTFLAGRPYTEVAYRIINTTDAPLEIRSLEYSILRNKNTYIKQLVGKEDEKHLDSTGCGDSLNQNALFDGSVYRVSSSDGADKLMKEVALGEVRSLAASSNYKTNYIIGMEGEPVSKLVDGDFLLKEANEHFAEVFHGTFFADCTDREGGVCATIFQAQQNYPKAVYADKNGIIIMLVPENSEKIVLQSGMSRQQNFLLHFHKAEESISSLNDRSIVYQMSYRPYVLPEVHQRAKVWPDIFPTEIWTDVEENLVARADAHSRAYGMLNFGDSYDANYTEQGRGGGRIVWCNNEYDYPHACALQFVRTGIRRFLDYNIASCRHWMDVDVCHYHKDPMYIGGQWEHTAGHTVNGVMVCSHEWVEGLLDYYNLTGDERGLETAIGIGENVERLLDMPMYAKAGEANARETGWALRTLTALYVQTGDKKWLKKCDKILNDFFIWEKQYGHWLAPYTDNSVIRVGFMISVAIGSLMRYYRFFPSEELKGLIIRAVDDMIENCYVEQWGIFYYKELPSLNRLGTNTLLLEALTVAYDLTGNKDYLKYGLKTFKNAMNDMPSYSMAKKKIEDAVIVGNMSSKNFAQSMIPLASFYRALTQADMSY